MTRQMQLCFPFLWIKFQFWFYTICSFLQVVIESRVDVKESCIHNSVWWVTFKNIFRTPCCWNRIVQLISEIIINDGYHSPYSITKCFRFISVVFLQPILGGSGSLFIKRLQNDSVKIIDCLISIEPITHVIWGNVTLTF